MKVAISQPMRGKTTKQILEERAWLVAKLENMGIEVLNTILDISEDKDPMYYLGESIKLLSEADAIIFMPGWELTRGCYIEHQVAEEYGKTIILLPEKER